MKNLVITGGGTGGHIYPAIAIARAMLKKDPSLQIHFVGAYGGLEEKIIPRENFPLYLLRVGKLKQNGLLPKLITVALLPWAILKSIIILIKLRPFQVLGVGGYASGPFLLVAALMGFRTSLWEANAFSGLTNRLLSYIVPVSYVVFTEAKKNLRSKQIVHVGLPVREAIESCPSRQRKTGEDFRILVFGGSQGARAINRTVADAVKKGGEWLEGVSLIHQTGKNDYVEIKKLYEGLAFQVEAFEFIHQMEKYYEWADLVICRSGSGTVNEIAACGKASILVPLPTAADNHQQKNAEVLVRGSAAEMILQKDFTVEKLIERVGFYKRNLASIEEYETQVKKLYQPRAAEQMAELLLLEQK